MNEPVEGHYDLTPYQRKYLRSLWEYCRTPPTLGRIYQKVGLTYLPIVLFYALLSYLCLALDWFEAAWVIGGILIGILLRDFGLFRRTVQLWPATEAVIDRAKLAELVQEHTADPQRDEWS
jgi:hypothetical protein